MHFRREPWCQQICFRGLGANSEKISPLPVLSWLTFSLQFWSWQTPSQLSKNCLQISGIKILVWEIHISNTLCLQSDSYKININVLSKSTIRRHFFSFTNFNQDDLEDAYVIRGSSEFAKVSFTLIKLASLKHKKRSNQKWIIQVHLWGRW